MVLYALRTEKLPFIQSNPSVPFFFVTMLGIVVGTIVPFTELGTSIGLASLPGNYWIGLAITLVAYIALVTVVKNWYVKSHGNLL